MTTLAGCHALVTGAGSGIGAAIAHALAMRGAAVSLVGRRKGPLENVAAISPRAAVVPADITKQDDCVAMIAAANKAHGPIDIVIANAGAAASAPSTKLDLAHWNDAIGVNLTGAFLTVNAALPDVLRKGEGTPRRIIFVASTAGLKGYPYVAAYCAAKHGVVGYMRALAVELATKAVTVNAVCPGFTETPLFAAAAHTISAKTGRSAEQSRADLAKDNAHGRLITPQEVADTVLWLCSPGAVSVNGQAIAIAGGPV